MENALHDLTKHVFYDLLNKAGKAYLLVRYSREVVLGGREFTQEEKERGIMLVFNERMKFQWDTYGITATLVFGSKPERCFIPLSNIAAVFSPELGVQLAISPRHDEVRRVGIHEAGGGGADASRRRKRDDAQEKGADPLFAGVGATPRSLGRRKIPPEGKLIRVDFAKKKRKRE